MSSSRHGETPAAYIEERASDDTVIRRYKRGKLLGKGGFARCYELTDLSNNRLFACKFIAKSSLVKQRAKDKLKTEIEIHSSLHHNNIVEFYRCWEDSKWVYILLELCPNHTLMEMVKARKRLTEPEVQLYLLQLIGACRYMQSLSVIHRDLKLGNLFLGPDLEIKVGDFGLATRLAHAGEKKRTICGTPNYIAPEILEGRRGHSYEVDAWSIGVIVYTMLIGKPPFETADVKSTYKKIKANQYTFPSSVRVSDEARSLIRGLLSGKPEARPSLSEMLAHPFMARASRLPRKLPVSAVRSVPHDFVEQAHANGAVLHSGSSARQPLGEIQPRYGSGSGSSGPGAVGSAAGAAKAGGAGAGRRENHLGGLESRPASARPAGGENDYYGSGKASAGVSRVPTSSRPATSAGRIEDRVEGVRANLERQKQGSSGSTRAASASSHGGAAKSAGLGAGGNKVDNDDLDAEERGAYDAMHQKLAQSFAAAAGDAGSGSGTSAAAKAARAAAAKAAAAAEAATRAANRAAEGGADLSPPTWVTKWVDYSNKYGLGYQLSDGTMGVYFNDSTKIVVAADGEHVEYYDRKRTPSGSYDERQTFLLDSYPDTLQKKVTLLKHFSSYLQEHTAPSAHGDKVVPPSEAPKESMVYVKKWMMTRHAIIFRLSNKTVQTNFFDHTKLVLSAEAKIVTYINKQRELQTFPLHSASTTPEISRRLKYAKDVLFQLISKQQRPTATA